MGTTTYDGSKNLSAAATSLPVLLCPSDIRDLVAGDGYAATNYAACAGTGQVAYGSLTAADGMFGAGFCVRMRDVLDGVSHTALVGERLLGPGLTAQGDGFSETSEWMLELAGAADTTSSACAVGAGDWNGERGARWIFGNYCYSIYNHALAPNASTWDCTNQQQQKGRMSARSRHPGGVNTLFVDGSIAFIVDDVDFAVWQSAATRRGAEIPTLPFAR